MGGLGDWEGRWGSSKEGGREVRRLSREAEKQVSMKRAVLTLGNLGAVGELAGLQPREESQGKAVLSSPP